MKVLRFDYPKRNDVYLEAYLLDCELTFGQEKERPAVVICPGGGYHFISPRETEPIALAYAAKGLHAFVLHYSCGQAAAGFHPLKEVSWAVGLIREHAKEWFINPQQIASCGFSAGGHLALAAGLIAENKTNAIILGYPGIKIEGPGSEIILRAFSENENPTEDDAKKFDLTRFVKKDAPPLFMYGTAEDAIVGLSVLELAQAYTQKGVLCELHMFQFGPHGFSLATTASANGSSKVVDDRVALWHSLSVEWLLKIFGEPVLLDKSASQMNQLLSEEQKKELNVNSNDDLKSV